MTATPLKVNIAKGTGHPDFEFRGGNRDFIAAKENEVILAGGAESGKTVSGCFKLHTLCLRRPRANAAIVRKSRASMAGTVLKTWAKVTKGQGYSVYGGENPTKYVYHNGSTVWVYGLDNPDRLLSAEFDCIYVNQAEEITQNDWETIATRCTGRAGNVLYPQIMGDCNPGGSQHWIRKRKSLRLITSTHRDNPSLYDRQGNLTEDGAKRMARLEAQLTGVRRKRLLQGIWASAEGAVFDTFDAAIHVCQRKPEEMKRWLMCQDEGYVNPAVILLVGEDSDGRWHVFREYYKRGVLQGEVVKTALAWFNEFGVELDAVDAAAAGLIADLVSVGVRAIGGKGRVLDGITALQNRLQVQADGRPRLSVDPSCVETINEMESYQWIEDKPKDTPKKEFDHSVDSLRYLCDVLAEGTGAFESTEGIRVGMTAPSILVPESLNIETEWPSQ